MELDNVRLINANKLLSIFCADCGMRELSHSNSCEKDCDIYDTIMACPTVEAIPCTFCMYSPHSSGNSKLCTACSAVAKGE